MDDDFLLEFIEEAREHLAGIESDLLQIEDGGSEIDEELVNKVFRAAHTIKGGSGFFDLPKVTKLAHKAETVLDMLRSGKIKPNAEVTNVLLAAFDMLRDMINNTAECNSYDIAELLVNLEGMTASYLPEEEKETLTATVTLSAPDDRRSITLPRVDFDRAVRNGLHIYWIECNLIHDIERNGIQLLPLFKDIWDNGEIVECKIDFEAVGTLDSPQDNRVPLSMVVATARETGFLKKLFQFEDENLIHVLHRASEESETSESVETSETPERLQTPENSEISERSQTPESSETVETAESKPEENTGSPAVGEPQPENNVAKDAAPDIGGVQTMSNGKKDGKAAKSPEMAAEESLRINVGLLENLMNLAGELVLSRNQLRAAVQNDNMELLVSANQRINQVTSELQDVIMQTRLQPIGNVFNKFPRVVRDISRSLNKEINLDIRGKDVALDKTLIEGLSDPLTHMVRNAVDHGIESADERRNSGKSPVGNIRIEASYEAGQVIVEVSDDGKGIDPEKIAAATLAKGLITGEKLDTMSDQEKQALVLLPGLSTAGKVSDLSGRGVGMDVVKTNLDRLGGQIEIRSITGQGSLFRIKLPLTLAIIPSLIVSVRKERFAIPQTNIEELLRLRSGQIKDRIQMVGDSEVLLLRDRMLPLVRFQKVMGSADLASGEPVSGTDNSIAGDTMEIAVVTTGTMTFALAVDSFHDTEEVVVKPLGRRLKHLREYSGATILGDGKVALILDMAGLAEKVKASAVARKIQSAEQVVQKGETDDTDNRESLLIFHNGPKEPCALPLEVIDRIERITDEQIETLNKKRTMKYRGGSLTLVALSDAMPVASLDDAKEKIVLVSVVDGRDVGLLASMPVDVLETRLAMDTRTHRQNGVAGSAILQDKTTLVIDLQELVRTCHPDWSASNGHTSEVVLDSPVSTKTVTDPSVAILLAEDSDFFRKKVKNILEEGGYQVLEAPDGEAAWNTLIDNLDFINLVVTDIEMPRLNGLDLTRRIRKDQRTCDLPVIAVSSLAGDDDFAAGLSAGVTEYQIKLDREKLLASVGSMMETVSTQPQ